MKQARLTGAYEVQFEEVSAPQIQAHEVLLKINCLGVCGTDMQIYHGKHKYVTFPIVIGHEIAATVVEAGSEVLNLKVGDQVTLEPQVSCGTCTPCRQGRFNVCESLKVFGVHLDGCDCEYFAVDPQYLHRVPADMNPELVALVEPMAVAVGCVQRSTRVKGGKVAVVGAGTIGNLVAQAAKAIGAEKVLVADINQSKLDYALDCGIDYAVNTSACSLAQAIVDSFGEDKADVIIDCAAVPAMFGVMLEAARPNSDIILTGNYKASVDFDITRIQRREISLIGHMMYVREDFQTAIEMLHQGKINVDKIISQRYSFDQYAEALQFYDEHPNDVFKMLIHF